MALLANVAFFKYCTDISKCSAKLCGSSIARSHQLIGCRHLYSPSILGLDQFESARRRTSLQFTNIMQQFKENMSKNLISPEKGLVFMEDLKNMIYLAEAEEKDVELVLDMAKRYNQQHRGIRFGSFVFGPEVMRLLHFHNQPDAAKQALEMKELEGFFDQMISYQVAMNLLYVSGRYSEALEIFQLVQDRRIAGVRYPKNCFTLAIASYYKMDTPVSMDTALLLLESAQEYGLFVNRRLLCLVAALCINQGHPSFALKILASSTSTTHLSVTSLKVVALSQLGRLDEMVAILRSFTQLDLPTHRSYNHRIHQESIASAEEAMARTENKELSVELQRILKSLREHNQISPKTIDDVITEPIAQYQVQQPGQQERARLAASFSGHHRHSHQQPRPRRGLTDME